MRLADNAFSIVSDAPIGTLTLNFWS